MAMITLYNDYDLPDYWDSAIALMAEASLG
jgi:hypothetical protein